LPELELLDDQWCFACGKDNPIGLKTEWEKAGDAYICRWTPKRQHQGYMGVTHGGIVATLLDEAMARLVWAVGYRAVTAEMTVRLRKPAKVGVELTVSGRIISDERRIIHCQAEATDPDGEVIASATGKMMKV
jgi:uncharacterized protein (TIGR00369 family)